MEWLLLRIRAWGASAFAVPLGLFGASLLLHALTFLFHGPYALGYDTGFYRRYLIQPFISFPNAPVPGLGGDALVPRVLLDTLRLLHLPPDIVLYGSYLVLFALLPALLYWFLKPSLGKRGALLAGILCIFSAVSYEMYWYMLWKNIVGLDLLLLAFICIERNLVVPLIAIDLLLALSHKTTALIYIGTLAALLVFRKDWWGNAWAHISIVGLALGVVALHSLTHALAYAPVAVFLETPEYLTLSLGLIIVIVLGIRGVLRQNMPKTLVAFALVCLAFPIFGLAFYERVFVYLDVVLVSLAAFAISYLWGRTSFSQMTRRGIFTLGILCIAGGLFAGSFVREFQTDRPLVSRGAVRAIEDIGALLPSDAFILTSTEEAPWYEGWTTAHIIAPGMLHDSHNFEAWVAFWDATSTKEKTNFIASFPRPLYISSTDLGDLIGPPPPCVKKLAPILLVSTCRGAL